MRRSNPVLAGPLAKPISLPLRRSLAFAGNTLVSAIRALFATGQQGVWYDPSDLDTTKLTFRRNLLTRSEQFNDAVWTKVSTASVTGTNTINLPAFGDYVSQILNTYPVAAGTGFRGQAELSGSGTVDLRIKRVGTGTYEEFNTLVTLTSTPTTYFVSALFVNSQTGVAFEVVRSSTSATTLTANKAQLEVGSTATDYQRITDYFTEFLAAFPLHTLFQDSAGTTPVTVVEQPVGLMLDKRLGAVRGVNLATANYATQASFDNVTTTTSATSFTQTGGTTASRSAVAFATVANQAYEVFFTATSVTTGAIIAFGRDGPTPGLGTILATSNATAAGGTARVQFVAASAFSNILWVTDTAAASSNITGIGIRAIPGNHATQATAASRLVVSARVNLLTNSGGTGGSGTSFPTNWTQDQSFGGIGPTGITTGLFANGSSGMQFNIAGTTSTTGRFLLAMSNTRPTVAANTAYTFRFSARQVAGTTAVGIVQVTPLWYDAGGVLISSNVGAARTVSTTEATHSESFTSPALAVSVRLRWDFASYAGTIGTVVDFTCLIGADDFRLTADVTPATPAYQRVNTASDYDTAGFPMYLRFDGVDDGMATGNIDFTATDRMTVWAGVTKLSDAAIGVVAEHGTLGVDARLATLLLAPGVANTASFRSTIRDGVGLADASTAGFAAPTTRVVAVALSYSTSPQVRMRVDAVDAASATVALTGSFGNFPLHIGRRSGGSLFFNGRMYSLIIRGTASSAAEIAVTERYVASKTGVTL